MSLQGLGKIFENDEKLRALLLNSDSLIAWPSPKLVGVVSNKDSLRMNYHLLTVVADHWCPQWCSPAMIPIDEIKAEVHGCPRDIGELS